MSAYVVSDSTIHALVQFAVQHQATYYFEPAQQNLIIAKANAEEIGQKLINENIRSVNYRYQENGRAQKYKLRSSNVTDPVTILKLINHLDYQSCETNDWRQSEAFAILAGIKDKAIYALPGYEAAPWGINQ